MANQFDDVMAEFKKLHDTLNALEKRIKAIEEALTKKDKGFLDD